MTIKAIETRYKGYRFRSRLEARWAVFFDTLGFEWEYEKQGYQLPSGLYLPDFWLPAPECWCEIKPEPPTPHERALMEELVFSGPGDGFILVGVPSEDEYGLMNLAEGYLRLEIDDEYASMIIRDMEADPDEFGGKERVAIRLARIREHKAFVCRKDPLTFSDFIGPEFISGGRCDYLKAITAARSARFEHGETPK